MAQTEHFFQCKLFINGIGTVKRASVRPLNAADPAVEILPERMMAEIAEVVQPDVGRKLKFQNGSAVKKIPDQFFPAGRGKIGSVKSVPDAYGGHLLPGGKGLTDAHEAVCHIVAQSIIFSCMNPYDKARYLCCDFHKFPYNAFQFKDIIDFLSDNVTACHIRISGDCPQHPQVFGQIVVLCDAVSYNCQRDAADPREKPEQHTGFRCNGRHNGMNLA